MKIAILGFDRQGKSAYRYWKSADNHITVCDRNTNVAIPDDCASQLGENYLKNLDKFDVLVRTPGLHPQKISDANPSSHHILDKVTTVTNEFLNICPSKNIIGVTGTKGKGTTSTLIANILSAAGKRVHLGGNIGLAPLEMLDGTGFINDKTSGALHGDAMQGIQPDDWVVLELANFQLIDLKYSPHIAVCLMITPEHLDWHKDIDEYLRAKQQLFAHQAEEDIAIYKSGDNRSMHLATSSHGRHVPYLEHPGAVVDNDEITIDGHTICSVDDVALPGAHNLENICAAITAVWSITQDSTAIEQTITQFSGLPYRLQYIKTIDRVSFYNDSFGTTPETAIVAIDAMIEPTVVILGGSDKKSDYSALANKIKDAQHVSNVIVTGQTGPTIKQALDECGYTSITEKYDSPMEDIVATAYQIAKKPGAVLLSPACASFDMFENYMDRGDQFNQAVRALAQADE